MNNTIRFEEMTPEEEVILDRMVKANGAIHDPVNQPAHYQFKGGVETWDIITDLCDTLDEDGVPAIQAVAYANVIKYVTRMWRKGNPRQDAEKARWYLDRLINRMDPDD